MNKEKANIWIQLLCLSYISSSKCPGWDLCSLYSCWGDEKRPVSSVMSHRCVLDLSAGKQ